MTTIEPNYNDVCTLNDGFEAWRHTYEYRGIKYDIVWLRRSPSRWFVVEPSEATRRIVRLINRIDIRHDFLYHVCDQHESWKSMFYDAVDRAKNDIDWFLDDALNDLAAQMKRDRTMYSETVDEIRGVNQLSHPSKSETEHTVLGHNINDIWDDDDAPESEVEL